MEYASNYAKTDTTYRKCIIWSEIEMTLEEIKNRIELCKARWEITNKEGAFKRGEFEHWIECADTILEELER